MELDEVVRRRRMVRNYDPDRPVPAAVVERLLGYAVRAPSAGFSQGWGFLVLDRAADRDLFWSVTAPAAAAGPPAAGAPAADPPAAGAPAADPPAAGAPAADPPAVPSWWLAGMRRAPLIVVPHANRDAYLDRYAEPDKGRTDRDESDWPVPYWHIDAGFASLLMLLGAVDAGLGACFFGIPRERTEPYRAAFAVPAAFMPIGALTVGYPAPDRRSPSLARGRRPVSEVAHRGRWGKSY